MECTKCGSELNEIFSTPFISEMICMNKKCEKFGYAVDLEYQARLDKVLSKFKKNSSNMYFLHPLEDLRIAYDLDYQDKGKFMLWVITTFITNKKMMFEISLDTVESLLKDLEDNQ